MLPCISSKEIQNNPGEESNSDDCPHQSELGQQVEKTVVGVQIATLDLRAFNGAQRIGRIRLQCFVVTSGTEAEYRVVHEHSGRALPEH